MAVRLILELVLGIALVVTILVGTYRYAASRPGVGNTAELDVSRVPSNWFIDSRTTADDHTEVCIIRVETKSGLVRERRGLRRFENGVEGHHEALDKAMDEACAAMRVADVI